MRKLEVVAHLASETDLSRAAAGRALDAMLSAIGEALARDEAVAIAASNTPVFRAGKALRDAVG